MSTADSHRPGPKSGNVNVRADLLRAAQQAALDSGIEGMALRDIAERAGVTQAMIRYYFGDKHGLLSAMLEDGIARLLDAPDAATDATAQISKLTSKLSDMPWLPLLMMQAVYSGTELRPEFMTRHAPRMMARLKGLVPGGGTDPMAVLTLLSALIFPHVARPLVESAFGMDFDAAFAESYAQELASRFLTEDADAT